MAEWFYWKNNTQYGPLSAKQLRKLARSRQIGPTDEVGSGVARAAAKDIHGFIHNLARSEAIVHIVADNHFRGLMDLSPRVRIKVDGMLLGEATVKSGFHFTIKLQPGEYQMSVAVSVAALGLVIIPEKHFELNLPAPMVYWIKFGFYHASLQNSHYNWNLIIDNADTRSQLWEAERSWWQCPHCGAHWAVEFLGEECTNKETQWVWMTLTDQHWMPNPNFGAPLPSGCPDLREGFASYTERQEKVPVVHETWHKLFQCDKCKKKWRGEDEIKKG